MKRIFLTILIFVFLIAVPIVFINADKSLSKIQKENYIRIGYAIEAPFAFLKQDGEVTGVSPEVAKVIVKKLGIQNIEWRLNEFGNLIDELNSEKIDIIAAGMYISPERAKLVSFSEPTFHVNESFLVVKGNPKNLTSFKQALTVPEIILATLSGSIEEYLLRKIGFSDDQLVLVPDTHTGKTAVESGLADGLALSAPTGQWLIAQDEKKELEVIQLSQQPKIFVQEKIGYGSVQFRKKDKQLQEAWNKELKSFIGSEEHLKIIEDFGFTENELPGNMSTNEILSP